MLLGNVSHAPTLSNRGRDFKALDTVPSGILRWQKRS